MGSRSGRNGSPCHDGSRLTAAIEIVALSSDAQEERYTLISKTFKEAAIEMGKPVSQAEEAAIKMVEWTRSTVMIIEAGDGAATERD